MTEKHPNSIYAPYVDMVIWVNGGKYNGAPDLKGYSIGQGAKFYNLGFINYAGGEHDGYLDWGWAGNPVLSEGSDHTQYEGINRSIADLRAYGGDIIISFGGAIGTPFWAVPSASVDEIAETYKTIVDLYELKTIDLDIEGGEGSVNTNIGNNRKNAQAIKKLQNDRDIDVNITLAVSPDGLLSEDYQILRTYLEEDVTVKRVNLMTMCYDDMSLDYGLASIDAVDATAGQLQQLFFELTNEELSLDDAYAMIGTTPSIGFENDRNPVFTTENYRAMVEHANREKIGQVSMWVANRDSQEDSEYGDNPGITDPYEFGVVGREFEDSTTEPPIEETIIEISGNSLVEAGQDYQYTATVNGEPSDEITWFVTNGTDPDTVIDPKVGLLSVGDEEEDQNILRVTAELMENLAKIPEIFQEATTEFVEATNETLKALGEFNVTVSNIPEETHTIEIIGNESVTAGTTSQYTAIDENNEAHPVYWSCTGGNGSSNIDASGLFSASTTEEDGTDITIQCARADDVEIFDQLIIVIENEIIEPDSNEWDPNKVYDVGDKVTWHGEEYEAQWWTQGDEPGKSEVWICLTLDENDEWTAEMTYNAGDVITYNGVKYEAKWWTKGDEPGETDVWKVVE
ncbi:MAG: hypothetical protein EHM25_00055 [Nitrosopumilales archaeon]|nr:MAG: hypothetical protein EHM25_12715 [Nitrosopumilales archaeon]RPJ31546.1 MAG: hypothetical protein EHM25_02615 [Nitrosopumilales archaeon]RPJ32810.1 MAG: hypothetical protein EHM25_00055 [Nitrosopumilales archaeon]